MFAWYQSCEDLGAKVAGVLAFGPAVADERLRHEYLFWSLFKTYWGIEKFFRL
jgi:hypothetical protein